MTEVTQGQYVKVMGTNPSYFQRDNIVGSSSNHPVESASWEDAFEFCKKLSELPEEKKASRVYLLPTEAEREYACRAGRKMAYDFVESWKSLGDYARFDDNSNEQTQPVGEKKPNAWGLYNMHGNVFECCSDRYGEYPKGAVSDPTGPREGSYRVSLGWPCFFTARFCRSGSRCQVGTIGFRMALSSPRILE